MKDWLPALGVMGAAIIAGVAASFSSLLVFRRSGQDLQLKTQTAHVEAEKLELSQKQLQAQREEMVTEITERMGKLYNGLLTDANTAIDRLRQDMEALKTGLEACERRDAENTARLARIEQHARTMGWELP